MAAFWTSDGVPGDSRGSGMWAISEAARVAISRIAVRMVPSAGSRTEL